MYSPTLYSALLSHPALDLEGMTHSQMLLQGGGEGSSCRVGKRNTYSAGMCSVFALIDF